MNVHRAINSRNMMNLSQRSVVNKVRVPLDLSPSPIPEKVLNSASDGCFSQFLVQNHSNFGKSGPPARCMYYQDGSWTDFGREVVDSLREGFREGKAVVEFGTSGAVQYLFDLYRMLQVDMESGSQRSIAWIDVHGKPFFPKTFVDGGEEGFGNSSRACEVKIVNVSQNPNAEIDPNYTSKQRACEVELNSEIDPKNPNDIKLETKLDPNSTTKKRDAIEVVDYGEGCSSNEQLRGAKKPRIVADEAESPRWPKTKLLKEGNKDYDMVKKMFLSGTNETKITSIYRCVRNAPMDNARCQVFVKQLETMRAIRGDPRMVFAWYGASAKDVSSILTHGFSLPTKVPDSEAHGTGIYLNPLKSPQASTMFSEEDDNGEKHVILCRVILGKCEKLEAGSAQSYPSSVDFDSGVDDLMNPKWYVMWCANMNTRILPECVVSYKTSPAKPDRFKDSAFVRYAPCSWTAFLGRLLNKAKDSLAAPRLKEVQVMCTAYKDGELAKDAFIKQLRAVVGDELMLSTIHEFGG